LAALLLVGTAGGQTASAAAPAAVAQIHKTTIYNGGIPTVSYSVEGGSPRLQALVQKLQFTENELNLTGELQQLRLGIVANEQTMDAVRTSQQLGLGPISTPACAPPDSDLKRALIPGLAGEATPAAAYELINLREQLQTELQAEQGKLVTAAPAQQPANQNAQSEAAMVGPVPQAEAPVAEPLAAAQALGQLPMRPGVFPARAAPPQLQSPLEQQVLAFQQTVRARIGQAQLLQSMGLQW
jgi:hypothetical protein